MDRFPTIIKITDRVIEQSFDQHESEKLLCQIEAVFRALKENCISNLDIESTSKKR